MGTLMPSLRKIRSQHLVHRLVAPEGVVGGVGEDLLPEAHLLEAVAAAQFARRARAHELVVVVEVRSPPLGLRVILARAFLLVDVGHVLFAKRPVVEPVVAHPAVHHGIHGHRDLQRRMRMDDGHQRQEAVIRDAQHAHLAVALRHILHQPVDGVVGIGRLIDGRRVLRPVQRPVHHEVALRAVLAANVLGHADVSAFDDHFGGVVVPVKIGSQVRAVHVGGHGAGVIRRARKEHRRVRGALRHQDHGVQANPVAHGDHDFTARKIEALAWPARGAPGFRSDSWDIAASARRRRRRAQRWRQTEELGERRTSGQLAPGLWLLVSFRRFLNTAN